MKNKKGFSLMELLVVIIIVAIISLIATPVVNTIIKNSKRSTFESSVKNMMLAIDWYLLDEYDGKYVGEKIFDLSTGGITEVKNGKTGDFLKYDGRVKGNGQIIVNEEGRYLVRYSDGMFCATKDYMVKKLTITDGECN